MIVGVTSWRGTGATTTAVAIAASLATRAQRPWLIEADPAGGVLTARFRRGAMSVGGLELVAFPEDRDSVVERFERAAAEVGGMRIVTAAGDPFRAWACHAPRVPWAPSLRDLDGPVVVDLGRLRGGTPLQAVLGHLDVLLFTADADVVSVVATMEWSAAFGRVAPSDAALPVDIARIAIVQSPTCFDPIGRTDAVAELGDRFAGWIPWDTEAIRALMHGVSFDDRRMRRSSFVQAAHHLTDSLGEWADAGVAA